MSNSAMPGRDSRIVTICSSKQESPSVTTLTFDHQFSAKPGQFVMVWIPGVDEIPMALSAPNALSVQAVGEASSALSQMAAGEKIGIRGPYGNGFSLSNKVLCIGGGVGLAPLHMIASSGNEVLYLIGGRTGAELLYLEEFLSNPNVTVQAATDDGSYGHHGFVTELITQAQPSLFDSICVCGPEKMMLNAYLVLKECGVVERAQFSMHRYMKCGAGICGSCCMDPHGYRVCGDGPVFRGLDLGQEEFGIYHRDASGRKVYE